MIYKLIAIDMDGTLLNSKKDLSSRTIKAINKAKDRGVNIVLSTGRLLSSAQNYANKLQLENHIIACNGAIIADKSGNIIYSKPLQMNKVEKIMKLGKKYSIYNHFYDSKTLYSSVYIKEVIDYYATRDSNIEYKILENENDIYKQKDLNAYKFLFIDDDINNLNKLQEELNGLPEISITKSWSNNLEVMDKDTSKGIGLEFLCNQLNIHKEEVIAIGDNENDLSMIKYAGLGVAMGNAEDIVKSHADYITSTNDEDGVAAVIEKFII
ncbi:Cof-type HAD-IIB family hydrolase [Tissierella sp. Yu-01]|uniref:Cof-type HAD-IIB family hydrolase n=1 Tax=Tissierella sp. Yu-01 TaxID=3035694 RepID=UPI00240E0753|nr:Cof-type HAD-IIB family hydrolase [Tissierella sp. Yu-01]WFA10218.1 Cof-type HAD-IIB family hydrolase [Tissierella sp. Yu-01]